MKKRLCQNKLDNSKKMNKVRATQYESKVSVTVKWRATQYESTLSRKYDATSLICILMTSFMEIWSLKEFREERMS